MTELRKVSGPSSPLDRHAGRIVAVVVIAVVIAIVKPWGAAVRPAPSSRPQASRPARSPTSVAIVRPRLYDFLSFGTNQPPPRWEMWPAGNLASFSFAMRVDLEPPATPSPGSSGNPRVQPTPAATPIPVGSSGGSPSGGPIPDAWPTIRIPVGSNLDLVGINSPLGYTVDVVSAQRIGDDGSTTPVRAILGTSPWPDHFTIIGYAPEDGPDAMQPWPTGTYRLELAIDPGAVIRDIDIVIEGAASPSASPASTPDAPSPADRVP